MSAIKVLVDTNIIVHVFEGNTRVIDVLNGSSLVVSVLTRMELQAWPKISFERVDRVDDFLRHCKVVPLLRSIQDQAVRLRRFHRIQMVDAIITATAVVEQIPFITADQDLLKLKDALEIRFFKT